jgi:hypothetical protein
MSGHEVRGGRRERDGEWLMQDDGRNRSGSGGMEKEETQMMRKDFRERKKEGDKMRS